MEGKMIIFHSTSRYRLFRLAKASHACSATDESPGHPRVGLLVFILHTTSLVPHGPGTDLSRAGDYRRAGCHPAPLHRLFCRAAINSSILTSSVG